MNEEFVNDHPHPTVAVEVGELREEIDIELAELIELLWKAGIETMMSCQETSPGISWIEFDSPDDFIRLLNLVVWYEEDLDSLYARANWESFGFVEGRSWDFELNLMDVLENVQNRGVLSNFVPKVSVRFPKSDISILVERLQPLTPEPALPTEPQVSQPS